MADVQYWDETLANEIDNIRKLISNAERASNVDKVPILNHTEKKLREAQGVQKSYKVETRVIIHPKQKELYEKKLAKLSEELVCCDNDLKAIKSGLQRVELFVGARSNVEQMTGEEAGDIMISDMNHIQDKTKSSLQNTKNMVVNAKQIGETTNEELLAQREGIRRIKRVEGRVEENLKRSDKLLKEFGKVRARLVRIQIFQKVR